VRDAPVRTPARNPTKDVVDQVDTDKRIDAMMAANYDHTKTPEIQIQPSDNPNDTPVDVQ
jgi:hypothetical protein